MYKTWPLACQQQVPTELEQKILFKWESASWCSELRLRMRFQPKSWLASVPAAGELLSAGKSMWQWMHTLTQLMKEESLLFLLPGHTSTGGCSGPQTCALPRERTVTLTCLPFIEVSASACLADVTACIFLRTVIHPSVLFAYSRGMNRTCVAFKPLSKPCTAWLWPHCSLSYFSFENLIDVNWSWHAFTGYRKQKGKQVSCSSSCLKWIPRQSKCMPSW